MLQDPDSNDDYYDCDNGDENANEFDARKFSGNAARLYGGDHYCDHDDDSDDEFGDVKKRLDTSNQEKTITIGKPQEKPQEKTIKNYRKKQKNIGLIKDELGGKIMKKKVALRPNMNFYSHMMDVLTRKQRTQRNVL